MIIAVGSIAIFAVYSIELSNICPIRQLGIADDLKKYDEIKDPQTCDALNTKISEFNSQCKSDVEELDCG